MRPLVCSSTIFAYFAEMKKLVIALAAVVVFGATACSNDTAFSETEKKTQDSADAVRQESGFDALENMSSDTSATASDSDTAKN